MRAEISENGILSIQSESALEAYALRQWLRENPIQGDGIISSANLVFIATNEAKDQ